MWQRMHRAPASWQLDEVAAVAHAASLKPEKRLAIDVSEPVTKGDDL